MPWFVFITDGDQHVGPFHSQRVAEEYAEDSWGGDYSEDAEVRHLDKVPPDAIWPEED